jgi:hypothetical protein
MTEAEWLAGTDPTKMLEFLRGKAGDRKLTLFVCACWRRCGPFLPDNIRGTNLITEQYADGMVRAGALLTTLLASGFPRHEADEFITASCEHAIAVARNCAAVMSFRCLKLSRPGYQNPAATIRTDYDAENATQCHILRDLFGKPMRPSPSLPGIVLAWNDRTIPRIAEGLYNDRKLPEGTLDAGRLAILADALLDAGCDNEELIGHCRSEGPHVRGCWAVDLLLGKS